MRLLRHTICCRYTTRLTAELPRRLLVKINEDPTRDARTSDVSDVAKDELRQQRCDDLSDIIRRKVAAGLLPKEAPVKVWAGYGSGKKCDACGLPTSEADIEYEIDLADHLTFLFHQACFELWHEERHLQP
jgi:hypothetical protein